MHKKNKHNQQIVENLQHLLTKSYAPYSKVNVSAIVVMTNNVEYFGINIENAAFSTTICAERCAIFKAISEDQGVNQFRALHLMSSPTKPLYPCGVCLQVMSEFFDSQTPIFIYDKDGKLINEQKLSELLPHRVTRGSF